MQSPGDPAMRVVLYKAVEYYPIRGEVNHMYSSHSSHAKILYDLEINLLCCYSVVYIKHMPSLMNYRIFIDQDH